jgi:glycosyltransferase involved in cell wall biosynthesis
MPWNDLYKTHRQIDKSSASYVCSISGLRTVGRCLDDNLKQRYFALSFLNALYFLVKIIIKNKKQDSSIIIHIHNMSLVPYVLFLRLFDIKFVLNVHNSLVNFNFYQYNLLKFGSKLFDAIIPVSFSVGNEVIRTFPWLKEITYPIENGIHVNELLKTNDLSRFSNKTIDVIVVARFVEQKNVSKVLSVLSKCKNLNKVVWYGKGIEMDSAKKQVKKSPLASVFEFKGIRPRREVLNAIDQSKIYFSLSKWEGLGVANLEALSLPTEVILSKIPPHSELFKDENLTLVDLDSSEKDIANIIDTKIVNYEKRESFLLARSAATRIRYDLRVLVGKYLDVYSGLTKS